MTTKELTSKIEYELVNTINEEYESTALSYEDFEVIVDGKIFNVNFDATVDVEPYEYEGGSYNGSEYEILTDYKRKAFVHIHSVSFYDEDKDTNIEILDKSQREQIEKNIEREVA